MRVLRVADFDGLEKSLQEKVKSKLLPASKVDVKFEVRRPPLEASDASRRVAGYGKVIYQELACRSTCGKSHGRRHRCSVCRAQDQRCRGGRHGSVGYGAHSNDAEYVQINTIVPRLYLATRMIMDISRDLK